MMARPEPRLIVDREAEAEVFANMLRFVTARRVMIVSDENGRGKTDLLRKLRYQCEYIFDPSVAVALFDFETNEVSEEMDVIETIAEQLVDGEVRIELPHFTELNDARSWRDTGKFVKSWRSVQGSVDLTGAELTGGAEAAGIMYKIEHVENLSFPDWTDKMERQARRLCKEAFFSDLLAAARDTPIVLLVDTVDAADEDLRRWVLRDLLRRRLLSTWEERRLLLVLAGTDVKELIRPLNEQQRECLEPVPSLAGWEEGHVRDFLDVHGYRGLSDVDIELVRSAIAGGKSLVKALQMAEVLSEPA
jgi:hypothetical protein